VLGHERQGLRESVRDSVLRVRFRDRAGVDPAVTNIGSRIRDIDQSPARDDPGRLHHRPLVADISAGNVHRRSGLQDHRLTGAQGDRAAGGGQFPGRPADQTRVTGNIAQRRPYPGDAVEDAGFANVDIERQAAQDPLPLER